MKMILTILKVVGLVILVIGIAGGGFALYVLNYHKKLKESPVSNIDLSKVKDGTYNGKWDAKMWTKEVQVIVADHKITEAKIIASGNIPMSEQDKALLDRVLEKQSLDVDAIAGSTITTKTILKSTEEALKKGIN